MSGASRHNYRDCELGEVIQLKRGYDLPSRDRREGEIPIVSSSGITGYHNKAKVAGPGVVTGRYGTLGEVHFVVEPFWPLNTALYVKDFKGNYPRFVAYLLRTLGLDRQNTAGAVPGVNRNILHRILVRVPDPPIQRRIADILSVYDDLIENNKRQMSLLEESIQLLYREWFVNLRFPGHERMKAVDGVPEGWIRAPLGDIASVVLGHSPPSGFYNQDRLGLPFHQGVTDFGPRFVTNRVYCTQLARRANSGDILFSVRAPVGRINLTKDSVVIGRGLAAIRSRSNHQSHLLYQLQNHFYQEDMIGGGAIYTAVGKDQLLGQVLLNPPERIRTEFEHFSVPVDQQIACLDEQNVRLVQARDALLPRLINGSIAV